METGNGQLNRIAGQITGVIYQNSENGYAVIRLRTIEGDSITSVGCFPSAAVGEQLIIDGQWISHASYGQQLKAVRTERKLPSDRRAIFDFLASGAVKGIGRAMAGLIVDKFGEQALDVIGEEPERLAEIKGISPRMAARIGADFSRKAKLRRLMEFFAGYGINPAIAVKVYKVYGEESIEAVKGDPYILTEDAFGASFFEADTIALGLGTEQDSPRRIEAAVIFELKHNLKNGHTFLPYLKLTEATCRLIGQDRALVEDAVDMLSDSGHIVREPIASQDACFLDVMHSAEEYITERLTNLAGSKAPKAGETERILKDVEKKLGIKYAPLQREAIKNAGENNVMVLTGGPGTGKTTAVRGILDLFDRLGVETALAAPTGRAAKRLSELTGREAQTIHRLLEAGYSAENGETSFSKDEEDPLRTDAVIVDEMSMVDITLMEALLRAMRPGCRLIMVGDADQLPSVGPGNVFSDIIRSGAVPTIKLTEIFRQAEKSGIVKNAHKINSGIIPELKENKGDFFFLQRASDDRITDTVVSLCAERLPKNMGIAPGQIQVLAPGRQREAGTANLNKCLQAAINPARPEKNEKEFGEFVFREGDRVMQIRNNYDIMWKSSDGLSGGMGIFNGDIGRITSINNMAETVTIDFEDRICLYPFDMLGEIEPAYAMTVHKSQGSEYKAVVLAVSGGAPALMTRSVLYTAVTRAKDLLIIVGDRENVYRMVSNDKKQKRYSGLKTRLSRSM